MREVREGFGVQISCATMRGEKESLVSSAERTVGLASTPRLKGALLKFCLVS